MNEVSLKDLKEEEEHIKDFVRDENNKLHKKLQTIEAQLEKLTNLQAISSTNLNQRKNGSHPEQSTDSQKEDVLTF